MLDNRKILAKKKLSKSDKEVLSTYQNVEEIFKQGVIILLLTLCFFVALGSHSKYSYEAVPYTSLYPQETIQKDMPTQKSESISVQETIPTPEEIQAIEKVEEYMDQTEEEESETSTEDDLALQKNLQFQIKDVYSLSPFTKEGSDFFNIMQLQKVLQKLGYFDGLADGTFTLETKQAIATVLINECNWPVETTLGVFGPKAKECIDNLYVTIDDTNES